MARGRGVPLGIGNDDDRFVAAALRVLAESGPAELTVRGIAQAAGSSTMGIYSRYGSRNGVLEAAYRRGFEVLHDALAAVAVGGEVTGYLLGLAQACRGFALANPALYAFMFERPVPGFDPDPQARHDGWAATFNLLLAAVRRGVEETGPRGGDPVRISYLLWCVVHGTISLELTRSSRSPLPGMLIDSAEAGEQVLLDGVRATLAGLGLASPP